MYRRGVQGSGVAGTATRGAGVACCRRANAGREGGHADTAPVCLKQLCLCKPTAMQVSRQGVAPKVRGIP